MFLKYKILLLLSMLAVFLTTAFSYAITTTTTYVYDDQYRLSKVTRSDGTVIDYQYDYSGNRSRKIVSAPGATVTAAFSPSTISGQATLAVSFTDQSTGSITSWAWNFGDGATSTAQNPAHSYSAAGSYAVQLTVNGSTSTSQTITVSSDTTAPVISSFALPSFASSLTVPISYLVASDATGVTGYMVKETSNAPLASDSDWSATAPTSYTFASAGSKILYVWVKDAAGNVSTSLTSSVLITISQGVSGSDKLAKTGQTICYNTAGTVVACAGSGHDGELKAGVAWPVPRFTDNGNGTITDKLTGLVWLKNASCFGTQNWTTAVNNARTLANGSCGLTDGSSAGQWRLPNVNELQSLIDISHEGPALVTGHPFTNFQGYDFWSSSSSAPYPNAGMFVSLYYGTQGYAGKSLSVYSLPVRDGQTAGTITVPKTGQTSCFDAIGNSITCTGTGQDGELKKGGSWPSQRFTENNNGTTVDNLTSLVWTKDGNAPGPNVCGTGTAKSWQGALDHVACLNNNQYLGYSDWRLPNRTELMSLINNSQSNSATWLNSSGFTNVQPDYYWSSSTHLITLSGGWSIGFQNGDEAISWSKTSSRYVWPVRGGSGDGVLPTITSFTLPASSNYLDVSVTSLSASDNTAVSGYCLTEINDSSTCSSWSATAPTTFSFATAGNKTLYAFVSDTSGNVSTSASASVTITLPPPATPSNFTAQYQAAQVWNYLSWSAVVGATGYKIYWGTTPGVSTGSNVMATSSTAYGHAGVVAGATYYYRVAALKGAVESALSSEVSATVPPFLPYGILNVTASSGSEIFTPDMANYQYRYGPSIILNGDTFDMWTAAPNPGLMDLMTHRRGMIDSGGSVQWLTDWTTALLPTPNSEDRYSICDPSVVFFNGYYYVGYTSTKSPDGKVNQVFAARCSSLPDNVNTVSCDKWNGSGWGGNPQPIIGYTGTTWGKGQPSFVVKDNILYIYYTDGGTKVVTVDATNANWPALINEGNAVTILTNAEATVTLGGKPGPFEVKYIDKLGKFIGLGVFGEFSSSSNIYVYESTDGLSFQPVATSSSYWGSAPIQQFAHNIGISGDSAGHLNAEAINFVAYGFGLPKDQKDAQNFNGRWPTHLNLVSVNALVNDNEKPVINSFVLPAFSSSLTVSGISLTASDNTGVTGYLLTESATQPTVNDAGWSSSLPTSYTFVSEGSKILYAWAKDVVGYISMPATASIVLDINQPIISAFTIPTTSVSSTVPITSFTVSDNIGVSDYCLTEVNSTVGCFWTSNKPISYTFTGLTQGTPVVKTLYAWAKDVSSNISAGVSATVTITLPDTIIPAVTSFTLPLNSFSLIVPIGAFTATDNVGIAGYCLTEVNASSGCNWLASAPTSYTFATAGNKTLYAWAKDSAGNVASSLTASVQIFATTPRTGQTICYGPTGAVVTCAGTGHDGDIQAGSALPSPRFIDNGNGTVTDNLTGIIWLKNANCFGAVTWTSALTKANTLVNGQCGLSDGSTAGNWRLPNFEELRSMINIVNNPAATGPFTNKISPYNYWSSTSSFATPSSAWRNSGGWYGLLSKTSTSYVWPIRSTSSTPKTAGIIELPATGQSLCYNSAGTVITCTGTGQDGDLKKGTVWPSTRFVDNGNQTITDQLTGLTWSKDATAPGPSACSPGVQKNWVESLTYISCLNQNNYQGFNDWRLPNTFEITSLTNFGASSVISWLNSGGFVNVQAYYYNTSTTSYNADSAFLVNMSSEIPGIALSQTKTNTTYRYYTWPVRGGRVGAINSLYNLVVSKTGTSSGNVFNDTGNIIWSGNSGSGSYSNATSVILTAVPNTGAIFSGWTGCDSVDGTGTKCTTLMTASKNITATFDIAPVNGVCGSSNGGTFTIAPNTNLCSVGTPSTVTGSGPWNWTCAGQYNGTNATCSANIKTYTLTYQSAVNGTLTGITNQTINHGASPSVVTANPDSGYQFINWTEGTTVVSTTAALTLTNITANHNFTANFLRNPTPPTGLSLTPFSSNEIRISWQDSTLGTAGHKLERKTNVGGTYVQLATLDPGVTTYRDFSRLSANTAYYYRVRATNQAGDSEYGEESSATTLACSGCLGESAIKVSEWTNSTGTINRIIADNENNVYVGGYVSGAGGYYDFLAIKFDGAGSKLWENIYDTGRSESGSDIALDFSGNFIMTGYSYGGVKLLKYNNSGTLVLARSAVEGNGVGLDGSGNIYIAGHGWVTNEATTIAKYDKDGNQQWYRTYATAYSEYSKDIALDIEGNIYVLILSGGANYRLVKYDNFGTMIWDKPFSGYAAKMAIDFNNYIYVTGNNLTIKHDKDGNVLWSIPRGGNDIITDSLGNIYTTGNPDIYAAGDGVIKYNSNGNEIFRILDGGYGQHIYIDGDGYLYVSYGSTIVKYKQPPKIDGICGSSNGNVLSSLPTLNLCITGTPTTVIGSGPWNWACNGINGGASASCSASITGGPDLIYTVNVVLAGSGTGSVTSSPSGIACVNGSVTECSKSFASNTPITLLAIPDWKSNFVGWFVACTGSDPCNFNLASDTGVTAYFASKQKVKSLWSMAIFATIQDAYNSAKDGETVSLEASTFYEHIQFNLPISIKLRGGKDPTYQNTVGMTSVQGSVTIGQGTIDLSDIVIR